VLNYIIKYKDNFIFFFPPTISDYLRGYLILRTGYSVWSLLFGLRFVQYEINTTTAQYGRNWNSSENFDRRTEHHQILFR
jgi:hypothetical protein